MKCKTVCDEYSNQLEKMENYLKIKRNGDGV